MWHTQDGMGWWMVLMGVFWLLFMASAIYCSCPRSHVVVDTMMAMRWRSRSGVSRAARSPRISFRRSGVTWKEW